MKKPLMTNIGLQPIPLQNLYRSPSREMRAFVPLMDDAALEQCAYGIVPHELVMILMPRFLQKYSFHFSLQGHIAAISLRGTVQHVWMQHLR